MDNTKEDKIIDKVRKILALSNNNPSEEESQSAMLKAQKLLAEHGLTMQQVENIEQPKKNVVDQAITPKQRNAWWHKNLALIIANNFRCYCYTSTGHRGTTINYLGLDTDIKLAKEVYEYAVTAIDYNYKNYVKGHQGKTAGIKNSYIQGYLQGLKDKFTEQVEKNNWGLILVKDNAVTEVYNNKTIRNVKIKIRVSNDKSNWEEGYKRGKEFSYNKQNQMIQ